MKAGEFSYGKVVNALGLKMLKILWILLLFLAAITFAPKAEALQMPVQMLDQRSWELNQFFQSFNCPQMPIQDFLQASDQYNLDFRLLPAIVIAESTCGKHQLYNNWFGIGGVKALKHYKNPKDSIYDAAKIIVRIKGKLSVYCPTPGYAQKIGDLMKQIP